MKPQIDHAQRRSHGCALALLCVATPLSAMQIEQLQVQFVAPEYQLRLEAVLHAPLPRVERVLRDYDAYPQLDQHILSAHALRRSADEVELVTRINVCFAFLCRQVQRVEQVLERPGELLATIIAARSDAESGATRTQLTAQPSAEGQYTQVSYRTQIVPKFWVPTWVARPLMLRTLREATVNMFEHIEQRAMQEDRQAQP